MGTGAFVNDRSSLSPSRNMARGRRSVDMPMVLAVIALVVFGLIMLYSASFDFSFNQFGSSTYMFTRQVKWLGVGILLALGLARIDYHHWQRVIVFAMLVTIGLLIIVLFINEIRLGASRSL